MGAGKPPPRNCLPPQPPRFPPSQPRGTGTAGSARCIGAVQRGAHGGGGFVPGGAPCIEGAPPPRPEPRAPPGGRSSAASVLQQCPPAGGAGSTRRSARRSLIPRSPMGNGGAAPRPFRFVRSVDCVTQRAPRGEGAGIGVTCGAAEPRGAESFGLTSVVLRTAVGSHPLSVLQGCGQWDPRTPRGGLGGVLPAQRSPAGGHRDVG